MSEPIDAHLVKELAGDANVLYLPPSLGQRSQQSTVRHASNPAQAQAAADYFESPDALHGDKLGSTTILTEKPIHRMMVYLSASGASVEDIATQTGYSPGTIRNVLRQPWARERMVQVLNETGRDRVKHFLSNQITPSLEVLQEIRDDRATAAAARITAANSILDRALGKPTQHVETKNENKNVTSEVSRLDAEIMAVQRQLADHAVTSAPKSN